MVFIGVAKRWWRLSRNDFSRDLEHLAGAMTQCTGHGWSRKNDCPQASNRYQPYAMELVYQAVDKWDGAPLHALGVMNGYDVRRGVEKAKFVRKFSSPEEFTGQRAPSFGRTKLNTVVRFPGRWITHPEMRHLFHGGTAQVIATGQDLKEACAGTMTWAVQNTEEMGSG